MIAEWWSQPVSAEGSTASEGIRRQLGKPHLDPLTVLIRETAQNTCDAALTGGGDVEFSVHLNRLSGNRLNAWTEYLLPEPQASGLGLDTAMARAPMILTIADRGTTGLGGPLRADEALAPGERADFVNFMRNVGERKELSLGGGSYGFGKGILYNVSRCHVVVADSVCIYRGRRQRRLIGAALGDGYRIDGRPFTGRHWLGPLTDGIARPLLDAEADDMAARLGLPRFVEEATGTNVVVVDVDLGRNIKSSSETSRTAEEAADFIVSTMLWNLWPRMLQGRANRLLCSMRRDGFRSDVPDPESVPDLRPFTDAYRAVTEGEYEVPRRAQEPREVGRFAMARGMAVVRSDPLLRTAAPFEGRAHHCARMRQADLVVDYVAGEPLVDEAIQYGAVFRASAAADKFFSESEPPTHDDWVLSGLRGTTRGVVQLANSFVRDKMRPDADIELAGGPTSQTPLGYISSRLSGLMTGTDGGAATASTVTPSGSRTGRRSAPAPRFTDGPILERDVDGPVVTAVVELPMWPSSRIVTVEPLIVVDGGIERPGEGDEAPEVIGWRSDDGEKIVPGAQLQVDRESSRVWSVKVRPVADAVIRLRLTVEGENDQ